ncbi:MAG: lamin tail domain-containing protein [Bradymonadales bacterium]|nr:lamin tail domain-containing protein [Bradymonadales bacterium]
MRGRILVLMNLAGLLGMGSAMGCGDDPYGALVINELAAAGEPNDWFEVHNGTDQSIDLSDYSFSDDLVDRPRRSLFPAGTVVEAGGYAVITLTDAFPGFALGSDEELGIYDPQGNILDSVDWDEGQSPRGASYGRIPDRTGGFRTLYTPTPGGANVAE